MTPQKIQRNHTFIFSCDCANDHHMLVISHLLASEGASVNDISNALGEHSHKSRGAVSDLIKAGFLVECGSTSGEGRPAKLYRLTDEGMAIAMLAFQKSEWLAGGYPEFSSRLINRDKVSP